MYHVIFDPNPQASMLFALLDLHPQDIGRYRDIYISRIDGKSFINIFTRNGGPNREHQQQALDVLQGHPQFLTDWDDGFDPTYAVFTFMVEEKNESVVKALYEKDPEANEQPMEKFRRVLSKMQAGDVSDPHVRRAFEKGKELLGPVLDKAKDGAVIIALDRDFKR